MIHPPPETAPLYACRARGNTHGLRVGQECGQAATGNRGLWSDRHHRMIRERVLAGETTWATVERRLRKKKLPGLVVGTSTSTKRKKPQGAQGLQRPKPALRLLKRLRQGLDPYGITGTYSEGVLQSTRSYVLDYPEIHSCLWLWPDGRVRNIGYQVEEAA